MAKVEERLEHVDPRRRARAPGRTPLAPLGTLTLAALLGNALAYLVQFSFLFLTAGMVVPPILIIAVLTLLVAGAVATGWRWTPLLGALVVLVTSTLTLSVPPVIYALTHPGNVVTFSTSVVLLACALVASVSGVGATIQNYRDAARERRAPGFLGRALSGLAGIVAGMFIVSLIVAANPPTSIASTTTNGEPTVHMSANTFLQNVVLVPKGSKLHLVDDGNVEHVLRNGFWKADGSPESSAEPGAPVVKDVTVTGGSIDLGPFATAGVYHLYCTIHTGMNLTIVVQ